MGETVDVLVVGSSFVILSSSRTNRLTLDVNTGANWGSGHRGGRVSALIGAVRANHLESTPGIVTYVTRPLAIIASFLVRSSPAYPAFHANRYQTFLRIGTGLNFGDYEWINAKPWKILDKENIPSWLIVSPSSPDDKGDIYLEPEE